MAATQVDDSDYLAAGYENGMVFIYQVHSDLSMTIAAQIMEDTDPIQSLNWQQLQHSSPWPLLAFSTKRKPQILLWSNAAQSIISSIRLPRLPSQASNGGQKSAATWVHVNWLQEDTLYFTSYSGAIVCADISNPSRPLVNTKKRMDKHARSVFVLDFINQGSQMISVSMDAQIIKWDTQFGSDLQTLKTQTKYPYCIDTPAWDKGQLAIAMGEKEIKYWKFSTAQDVIQPQADPNYYEATVIWRGLQGKIQRVSGGQETRVFCSWFAYWRCVDSKSSCCRRHVCLFRRVWTCRIVRFLCKEQRRQVSHTSYTQQCAFHWLGARHVWGTAARRHATSTDFLRWRWHGARLWYEQCQDAACPLVSGHGKTQSCLVQQA